MLRKSLAILALSIVCVSAHGASNNLDISKIDIPYTKTVLKNGLTLLVHEDHKAPIVAVNIWYHVGSKNEKPGRVGFAHLFEHLMFQGSENFNDEFFKPFEAAGATDQNGTTNRDRTNYFETVPTSAFDMTLWMESDRMGHFAGSITQAKLDEQRAVVLNEKRQNENEPYGLTFEYMSRNTYPVDHPYSWTTIGNEADLNAATLDDVKQWFTAYYGPNNAVLVISGDVTTKDAQAKVEKYFGDIPPVPPIVRQNEWIARRTGVHRQTMQDRVPHDRIYMVWNVPPWGSIDMDRLDLASDVLSIGKSSRLYKRLVYEDQIALDASAYIQPDEIGGWFVVEATAKPGVELAKVEKAVNEELKRFLDQGPTEDEMRRVKTGYVARFVRGIERIGGFGGKADTLAENLILSGDPAFYKTTLDRKVNMTAVDMREAAREWLSDGAYVLEVHPFPDLAPEGEGADRKTVPVLGKPPKSVFPEQQRATLDNGLKIVFAQRKTVPLITFNLMLDAGYAADPAGKSGTAALAMDMMDEGTQTRTTIQINEQLAMLGADVGTRASLDGASVSLTTLTSTLDDAMDIFADVALNPAFPEAELKRLREQQLARIAEEQNTPMSMAMRIMPRLIYGDSHPYGAPMTGSGTVASVSALTREDLVAYQKTWFKPNNATLIVVGDTTLEAIKPKIEAHFGAWPKGDVPKKNIATVEFPAKPAIYLIDKPGAVQSVIFAGHPAPPTNNPDEVAIAGVNEILGGAFISRINMNLREEHGWSYGAGSFMRNAKGQRPFIAYGPVQTDKTAESMVEMRKELAAIRGDKPPTAEELEKTKKSQILSLPGQWETMGGVASSIAAIVAYGLPENYYEEYPGKVEKMTVAELDATAKKILDPERTIWVVVGDMAKVGDSIKALNWGEVKMLDADGKPQ